MPPVKKFSREEIIASALDIIEKEGISKLNARYLAKKLGCSVNPIFNNFSSMEELNNILYERILDMYKSATLEGTKCENSYKGTGLAYIRFAKEHPEFFKILFMQSTTLQAREFISVVKVGEDIIREGQKLTGFSFEEQKSFHVKVWMFTHGIACLVAMNTVKLSDEEIDKLLTETVRDMIIGYKKGKENEKGN